MTSITQRILPIIYILLGPVALLAPVWLTYVIGGIILLEIIRSNLSINILGQFLCANLWPALLIGICLLSCIWSVDPIYSLRTTGVITAIYIIISAYTITLKELPKAEVNLKIKYIFVGFTIAVFMMILNQLIGEPLQLYKHASTGAVYTKFSFFLAIIIWASFYIFKTQLVRGSILTATMVILWLGDCDGCILGFALGITTYLLANWRPNILIQLVKYVVPIAIIAFPISMSLLTNKHIEQFQEIVPDISATHRLYIWQNLSNRIFDKPILGYGLNTTKLRIHPWEHEKITFKTDNGQRYYTRDKSLRPYHAHNFAIQIWLELGVFGFCLLIGGIYLLINKLKDLAYVDITLPVFTTVGTILAVNFSLWQTWLMIVLVFCTALIFSRIGEGALDENKKRT